MSDTLMAMCSELVATFARAKGLHKGLRPRSNKMPFNQHMQPDPAITLLLHAECPWREAAVVRRLGFMKAGSNLLACCALVIGAGAVNSQDQSDRGPMYAGKPLSSWVDELAAHSYRWQAANTNYPESRAVHGLGTNAILWLLSEMTNQAPSGLGGERPCFHQVRATPGFWALGETATPAIPKLLDLVEEEPEFVPRALAGIGLPGLTGLQQCLTNAPHYVPLYLLKKIPRERAAVSALAALFVSVDAGRIAKSEAAHLLRPQNP
jgi:hypothetical protein